ncbi:MAG: ATP-binding cassette domain-containing protein [Methanomicrobiales archaeon]|nr:ATP-binding cassette domain-containing protein [Methanomicrobiales archaeon]MDI6875461.1 ATP-binding cassette domain-containing protein [Methanomicrobiales archaeon]
MDAIEVAHLTKRFDRVVALQDVNFSVRAGEIFGYLGPNGAGKTTTIRILTGITRPTSGSASIFGHDIQREMLFARQCMGIVPETSNVYDDLTAWQNMIFTAELYHVGRIEREERTETLLRTFGLHARRHDRAREFSKGMKRRLTIAMGLVNNPRLLFLDEPTSGLDVESNLIIRTVIGDLAQQGVTVFLTTHNIEEANLMCDRVAIINHGQIAAIDTPERLKRTIQIVQSIEVAFDRSDPARSVELQMLPRVNEVRKEGDKFRLFTEDPSSVLLEILGYARRNHLRVISIATLRPSLEDVFIRLTGLQRGEAGIRAID